MVQYRRGHDDVEAGFAEVQVTDVALQGLYVSFRRGPEALLGAFSIGRLRSISVTSRSGRVWRSLRL